MNLSKLKKLTLRTQLPVLAGVVMVFGLFAIVMGTQQRQDTRSRAAGHGGTGNCLTVNASSGEDLVGDNCTIDSGFNGSVRGNGNVIRGGLGGSVIGNNNNIQGGVNGCIKGNDNLIQGGVNGAVVGTGNTIQGAQGTGTCPPTPPTSPPTVPPTVTPTLKPFGTCKDGIDNNQNELIDAGDPVCHTDGNQNNPNSYDPTRNEGPVTITVTPPVTVTPTRTPTPTQGNTTATPTVPPGNTSFILRLFLHGLGKGGDSANPNSGGNPNPLHPQRTARVEIYNSTNQLVLTKDAPISYHSEAGNFQSLSPLDMGILQPGIYLVKVKTEQFLRYQVPGILNTIQPVNNWVVQGILVNGDIDGNNSLNILDYNILLGCYSDFGPAPSCTATNKILSDLDDDGDVNQFDYNLFLRELTNRTGQ